jgi:8-oxo-dGTP pyrophosphatase MutT (NUDIX family)
MAANAGIYLLWKPAAPYTGSGYVLIHRRGVPPHQISTPGGQIDVADRTPLAAALRELHEESGIDIQGDQPTNFVWLGSSGGQLGNTYQIYGRVYQGGTVPPIQAPTQGDDYDEQLQYDFARGGFQGQIASAVDGTETRHYWADLDQLLGAFRFNRFWAPNPTPPGGITPITDAAVGYDQYIRKNLEKLKELGAQGRAAYQPYQWTSGGIYVLPAGTTTSVPSMAQLQVLAVRGPAGAGAGVRRQPAAAAPKPPTIGQQRVAISAAIAAVPKLPPMPLTDDSIITYVVNLLVHVVKTLAPISQIGVASAAPAMPPASPAMPSAPPAPSPDWSENYFRDTDLTPECTAAKFVGPECQSRFTYDRLQGLQSFIDASDLKTQTHKSEYAAYEALKAAIAIAKTKPNNDDEVEELEKQMRDNYPDVVLPIFDPNGPGPTTKTYRIRNPYKAYESRQGISTFADPAGSGSTDVSGIQANLDVLQAVAEKSLIADNRAATVLLESLWFCAKNPNGPGCYMGDVLQHLREFKAGKAQKDQAAAAKDLMKGMSGGLDWMLDVLKRTIIKKEATPANVNFLTNTQINPQVAAVFASPATKEIDLKPDDAPYYVYAVKERLTTKEIEDEPPITATVYPFDVSGMLFAPMDLDFLKALGLAKEPAGSETTWHISPLAAPLYDAFQNPAPTKLAGVKDLFVKLVLPGRILQLSTALQGLSPDVQEATALRLQVAAIQKAQAELSAPM